MENIDLKDTQIAIKKIKDFFEEQLSKDLNLTRVSSPLFVLKNSGLNDNLSGTERPVSFIIGQDELEIVHSLAKWKRDALLKYGFSIGEGLYTDMNAIRKDEKMDNIHSVYVDQWDWEKVISKEQRNAKTLKEVVKIIFNVFKKTEKFVKNKYSNLINTLPETITFISSLELEKLYPSLTPKQREYEITKKYGAVFISQIGDILSNGEKHDSRSPDYDDWSLNGDIIFYDKKLDIALELSSMGIRVDSQSLLNQLQKSHNEERISYPYHQKVINNIYPLTIGGGIGQSRMCMFFLDKIHIGEVQVSYWDDSNKEFAIKHGIKLL